MKVEWPVLALKGATRPNLALSCVDGSRVARTFFGVATKSGTVLCPACCRGVVEPLALMVSADRVPFCFTGSNALDIRRVFPIPGLTGSPSRLVADHVIRRIELPFRIDMKIWRTGVDNNSSDRKTSKALLSTRATSAPSSHQTGMGSSFRKPASMPGAPKRPTS